jgi:hypothetical protein
MLRSQHGGLVPETASPMPPLDLALDAEQVLLMALPERVRLVDLRGRFEPINLGGLVLPSGAAFSPVKLACDGQGGRWALDRRNASLARITGTPWRRRAFVDLQPDTFRPHPENPHEPALQSGPGLKAGHERRGVRTCSSLSSAVLQRGVVRRGLQAAAKAANEELRENQKVRTPRLLCAAHPSQCATTMAGSRLRKSFP